MLYPHCLLSWSTASKVNHNKHYLGLPDTFCILSFLLPTRQSSRSWPDRHNTPLLWIQKLILGEPVGERSHLSTGVAKVEDVYLQLLGVIFAGMQKELRRDRQRRDSQCLRGTEPWFMPTSLPSTLGAMSVSSQLQELLQLFFFKLIWHEFLSPTIQGFLNIQHH